VTRLEQLLGKLKKHYGALPEPPSDAFALFVWEVLSWHSTPRKRDPALAQLERRKLLRPAAMARAPRATLDPIVAAAGPYAERRLMALRRAVDVFRERSDISTVVKGPMPAALKALKRLTAMGGDAGAYRMLLFAGDHPVLPVNAGVERTARRLGYGSSGNDFKQAAKSVRDAVVLELPETAAVYRAAYVYLAHHGVTICKQADPDCPICPLKADCPGRKAIAAGIPHS